MLFFPSGYPKPVRVQGSYISDSEVNAVVSFLKEQNAFVKYDNEITEKITTAIGSSLGKTGYRTLRIR